MGVALAEITRPPPIARGRGCGLFALDRGEDRLQQCVEIAGEPVSRQRRARSVAARTDVPEAARAIEAMLGRFGPTAIPAAYAPADCDLAVGVELAAPAVQSGRGSTRFAQPRARLTP